MGATLSHRVLHVLSQRPAHTGSGITLQATVREAGARGWTQAAVVGTSPDEAHPDVGGLDASEVHPLVFEQGVLDFPVPGMSDVMPYPSSTFSSLDETQLRRYRDAWTRHLRSVVASFRPHLIHTHHAWIVSSLLRDVASHVPVVTQSHATGLRQMRLCPHLADDVRSGLAHHDAFLALHAAHARDLAAALGVAPSRVTVVGAGYRDELFRFDDCALGREEAVLFVGKISRSKGLPWLLDAIDRLTPLRPKLHLHVAGSGAGGEAQALTARLRAMGAGRVTVYGQLDQEALAHLMRRVRVLVLPSLFEGLPLVLIEGFASGCRVVVTDLDVVRDAFAPALGSWVRTVERPRLRGTDRPVEEDLPRFVEQLAREIDASLDEMVTSPPRGALASFTWSAVFRRIERVWTHLLAARGEERRTGG